MEIQFVSQLDRDLRACKLRTWPLPLLLVELHVLARPKTNPVRLPNISSESFSRIHQLCCVKVETLLYKDGSWFEKLCLKLSDIFPPFRPLFCFGFFLANLTRCSPHLFNSYSLLAYVLGLLCREVFSCFFCKFFLHWRGNLCISWHAGTPAALGLWPAARFAGGCIFFIHNDDTYVCSRLLCSSWN